MLKIDPKSNTLLSLGRRTLRPAPLFERHAVAELVANSPDVFFADLGRAFFLLGRDVPLGAAGSRVADLLLVDPEGRLFVGRLQHRDHRIDLVEALEDVSRIANWSPSQALALLDSERRELLQKAFLRAPIERINNEQGLLLLAESYDLDTLASAGWLKTRYGVRIDCYQLSLASDAITQIDYLSCQDLTRQIERVYQRHKSGEPEGAPWPTTAVPDISDRPAAKTQAKAPEAEAPRPAPTPPPAAAKPVPQPAPAPPVSAPEEAAPPAPKPQPAAPRAVSGNSLEAEVEAALVDEDPDEIGEMIVPVEVLEEDDPLADVIAGLEAVAELQSHESHGPPATDRRTAERSRDYQARRLRLDYFGRLLGARLVDFSSAGIGVEALSPLPVGAEIGISGEISGEAGAIGIEGRAKVEHCRSTEDGVCRIGFSLKQAKIREIADPETFDRR